MRVRTRAIAESTGINLVHWAVITNRTAVIPVLLAAKADINAMDDFGFTPLMYAATVDTGNTDTLTVLLKAGADRTVRNNDRHTALDQARQFKHAERMKMLLHERRIIAPPVQEGWLRRRRRLGGCSGESVDPPPWRPPFS